MGDREWPQVDVATPNEGAPMSIESLSWALNTPGVSSAERLVLIGVANHDGDGGAWPSMATLARYACVTERSVQRTIEGLVAKGFMSVGLNEGGTLRTRRDRRPNRYVLHRRGDASVGSHDERGDAGDAHGVTPTSPEPSYNHPEYQTTTDLRASEPPAWFVEGGYGRKQA